MNDWLDLTEEDFRKELLSRPIPDKLLKRLAETPAIPEYEIDRTVLTPHRVTGDYIVCDSQGKEVTITQAEVDVLRCVALGLTHEEVADVLGLKVMTVKSHVKRIIYRLRCKKAVHAVFISAKQGLI